MKKNIDEERMFFYKNYILEWRERKSENSRQRIKSTSLEFSQFLLYRMQILATIKSRVEYMQKKCN